MRERGTAVGLKADEAAVVAGELNDPTLSFQLRCGFEVVGVIDSYLEDTASGNYAAAIVWRNPDYSEAGAARER